MLIICSKPKLTVSVHVAFNVLKYTFRLSKALQNTCKMSVCSRVCFDMPIQDKNQAMQLHNKIAN